MDPILNQENDIATQVVRKQTGTCTNLSKAGSPRAKSGVRTWPPKPDSSANTLHDFDLDAESVQESLVIEAIPIEHLCVHCQTRLIDPDGVGICPKCGYCRSLAEGEEKLAAVEVTESEVEQQEEVAPRPPRFPVWIWGLLGGALLILGTAILISMSFPNQCRERTVWSTCQLLVGLGIVLVSQWWVILKLEPDQDKLGPMDLVVISGRLWSRAFNQMPCTLGPVYCFCWGMLIALTAMTITGGLADWFASPSTFPSR